VDDWLSVVLQEYQAIRAEILASLQTQQSALAFGTATIGILAAAAVNVWKDKIVPEMVFLGAIPTLTYFVLVIWMGEVARMLRAGGFMLQLENRVNGYFSHKGVARPLEWETRMRGKVPRDPDRRPMYVWNYRAIMWMFFALSLASICIGASRLDLTPLSVTAVVLLEAPFLLGAFVFLYRRWIVYVPGHGGWFRRFLESRARWILTEAVLTEEKRVEGELKDAQREAERMQIAQAALDPKATR